MLTGADTTVLDQLKEQVLTVPDRPAVSDAWETVTYRELWARARSLARLLRERADEDGLPVGICLPASVNRVAAMLGIMLAGSPYVPVDMNFPDSRITSILSTSGTRCVVVDSRTRDLVTSADCDTVDVAAATATDPLADAPSDSAAPEAADLAYILHTSGSTGAPKGVAIEHHSVVSLFRALDEVLPALDDPAGKCWLATTNICFDISVVELFWPLTRGMSIVVVGSEALAGRSSPEAGDFLPDVLASGRVSHFQATPTMVELMLADGRLRAGLTSVEVLIMGGEEVRPQLLRRLDRIPVVINGYGPTEATVYATMHRCRPDDTAFVPIGRPLTGVRVRVVGEDGEDCPPGAPGELLIGGAGLARGYLNNPQLTAEKFAGDVTGSGRWYATGDLVSVGADSSLRFHGRKDSQVKVRGFRVELGEIEQAVLGIPGVREAAVVPVRDDQNLVKGVRAAARTTDGKLTEAGILSALREELPWYALPDRILLTDDLPVNANGKLDRKTLEARLSPTTPAEKPRSAARGSLEQMIGDVWASVLGRPVDVETDRNFFDHGGNSQLLMHVFQKLSAEHPRLELTDMYRYPTIAGLSAHLRSARQDVASGEPHRTAVREAPGREPVLRDGQLSSAERRRLARRGRRP
ncbi:amino acid adenylation domain-containing protein [Streptomyces sp. NPDC057623]|uniref:non-ribosomal peptide synthetase n=1 Tax=Streptomyces sp. NPDC057623 TaxID=3346187 RepID=UPI0036BA49DB